MGAAARRLTLVSLGTYAAAGFDGMADPSSVRSPIRCPLRVCPRR